MNKNFYQSNKYNNNNINYGFFTRQNGESLDNYQSLNCSYSSGDKTEIVKKNITIAKDKLNLKNKKLKLINQTHSNKVLFLNQNNFSDTMDVDGIITLDKNICLGILTADCCPIFLFDDKATFICNLHAGWKGCYLNIIKSALGIINQNISGITNINAIIGPCLGQKNFEVRNDFKDNFIKINNKYAQFFLIKNNTNNLFNMRGLINFQLLEAGVFNIENIDIDTYSNSKLFFSHRRSTHEQKLPTGRMINIIGFN